MSKILAIITDPNDILRKKSVVFDKKQIGSKETKILCAAMSKTMLAKDGIGLAAPQIGKNVRLAVINTKNGRIFLINPKITKKSLLKEWGEEGCLSVPGVFGQVKRHKKITCEYLDQKSVENAIKAEGLLARVIQHEIDHLDGILFIDKAKNLKHDRITTLPKGA